LFGCDTDLLPNGRVIQKACETEFPRSHAETAPTHAVSLAKAIVHMAPSAALLTWPHGPHGAAWPEPTPSSLLLGRRILWVALRQDWGAAKRQSQHSKGSFRVNFHGVFSRIVLSAVTI